MTVVYVLAAALLAVAAVQLWRANRKVNAALATVQAPAPARTSNQKETTTR